VDRADIEQAIARTESWYAGGGWYTDGGAAELRPLQGWAMHLYPLWYCRIAGDLAKPVLAAALNRSRLRR